jgi:UDPglucose 6-dehydrogenase
MSQLFSNISYFKNVYEAIKKADALVVMTEWNEFRSLDLKKIRNLMNGNIILDTRNIMSMKELSSLGFVYDNVGRIKI